MNNKKNIIQGYVISTIGAVLTALGLVCFLIPNNIAAGGASGIAIVINSFIPISVGVLMYFINIVLFVIAFLTVGSEFGVRTIYCAFLVTFLVDLFERIDIIPQYRDQDLFVSFFFGVAISALGMAITFSQNASTGGTDIIARIANKFFGTSMGVALLLLKKHHTLLVKGLKILIRYFKGGWFGLSFLDYCISSFFES